MSGTTDIILMGAALIGGVLVLQNWPQIQAALQGPFQQAQVGPDTTSTAPGASAANPPSTTAGAIAAGSAGVTLTGKPSSVTPCSKLKAPISDADARRCKLGPYAPSTKLNNDEVFSNIGYYKGYNVPSMGPQWRYTVPYERRPEDVPDAYAYHTVIDPHSGAKIVTIDPYFPAGFYNTQANFRGSLRDPAVRGGS